MIERMLKATEDIWNSYSVHPFVKGIEEGTLSKEKFRYYIIQDYLYLVEYAKVFGIGLAKSTNLEIVKLFSNYIHQLTESEMDIHSGYMAELNITHQQLKEMPVALNNLSYTSYMLRVAYEEGVAEIIAAILACAYSYEVIARNMVKNNPDCINDRFYGDWIKGYSSEKYSEENKYLIDIFEKVTCEYTEKQKEHLVDIFVACSRYELEFWDMAWNSLK